MEGESLNRMDFLESEFKAMDEDGDGFLSRRELFQMMIFQGVEMTNDQMEAQLKKLTGPVDLNGFIRFMTNLPSRTRHLRKIFAMFTDNETSLEATQERVLRGLEELGVQNRQELITEMSNTDNNLVTYKDFARTHFKAKGRFN